MGFSRQEYWSGLPCPPPGDLPDPGIMSPALTGGFFMTSATWESILYIVLCILGFPGGSDSKASVCNAGDRGSIPGLGRFPWRRKWQPTPVFLPGKSHGPQSLVGYSPWGRKESDPTERLHFTSPHCVYYWE